MKKYILIIISFLALILVYFPKTFMGRIYIKDFEQRCFEPHYYDAVTYDMFKNATAWTWEENDSIDWFRTELEGTVIRISTSYNIDCYFYEDVTVDGEIWCSVNWYSSKGFAIVGKGRKQYGTLTDVEEKACAEAIKIFNGQVHKVTRKLIDKKILNCKYTTIALGIVWGLYFLEVFIKRYRKKEDGRISEYFEEIDNIKD